MRCRSGKVRWKTKMRLASRAQGTPSGMVVSAVCGGDPDAHSSAVQPVTIAT